MSSSYDGGVVCRTIFKLQYFKVVALIKLLYRMLTYFLHPLHISEANPITTDTLHRVLRRIEGCSQQLP